ncbi:hypothetical protein SANTM175S_02376 [Streptomyces antimycoticus]
MSQEIARITAIETAVDRDHAGADSELAYYAPAAAAALNLLAYAVNRGGADHDDVVQALKSAGVHSAFAAVLDAAAGAVTEGMDDPSSTSTTACTPKTCKPRPVRSATPSSGCRQPPEDTLAHACPARSSPRAGPSPTTTAAAPSTRKGSPSWPL